MGDPASGPDGAVVMAQITNDAGSGTATATLQGKSVDGADWSEPISWSWGAGGGGCGGSSDGVVQIGSSDAGTTVQLTVDLDLLQSNVYALAGTPDTALSMPAAFQVAAPFGADIGGVNPAFFPVNAAAEFDSYLTVGPTDGTAGAALSSIGVDFD